jgi:hypothetical protein
MMDMRFLKRWQIERRTDRPVVPPHEPLRMLRRWWLGTIAITLFVLLGGVLAMWLLGAWSPIPSGVSNPERLRLDRIKTGLTVTAGLAAGVTLLVALRRQAWSERAQRFAESDALEQRTTALYVAAAEQLGSDKAAVRLAGLYALERLGQDNPKLRQTVFDVWCAYLRMPYTPPIDTLRRNAEASPERPAPDAEPPDPAVEAERRQELEVRLTAQRLLGAHLSLGLADAGMSTYWFANAGNRLIVDLVGAVLVDFNVSVCAIGRANFSAAQFHGVADLRAAQFHDAVVVHGAQFHGVADLRAAQFHGTAALDKVRFAGGLDMSDALATSAVGLPNGWLLSDAPTEHGELRRVVRADGVPAEMPGSDPAR